MKRPPFYYFFCNHGTQGGIGFAFPKGYHQGKLYKRSFFGAYNIYKMIDAVEEFPGLKASHELDSYAFEEILKEDPEAIKKLKKYIAEDKAGLVGGTYAQPLGQDYGWESNIRQLVYGRKVLKDILDYEVESFLVEEQWFHPQLPQLLTKSGFKYASLQNQNSGQVKPMEKVMINWKGLDGSKLPTIPANDLQVSCVRQYVDYKAFEDTINKYQHPLLFQWVEIWPPGMDWGASATPFAKGIEHVKQMGGQMVTLEEFFENELPYLDLDNIYIPLDESNYTNAWYQAGGWGYDGDKVIMEDKQTESALLSLEILSTLAELRGINEYPSNKLTEYWKRFMVLQNHDFSVARNYRAFTEEGLKTEAASLGVVEYKKLREECKDDLSTILDYKDSNKTDKLCFYNSTGVNTRTTVDFELSNDYDENLVLKQNNKKIPFHITEANTDTIKGIVVIDLPAIGRAELEVENIEIDQESSESNVKSDKYSIEDSSYLIKWIKGSWAVEIIKKDTGQSVEFTGFTGPIAKQNEHDGIFYPALSPGHKKFTFAFDGATHSPDQLADIEAYVEETGNVKSTLVVRSDLLTLYTTDTPVAFAEARVSVNHITGKVKCESYFYTGVYLGLNCHAEFKHNLENCNYYRDFPFGEEKSDIDKLYANTYMRVLQEDKGQGFTLIHPGVQKVLLERRNDGGIIKHLLARDKVFGEYRWTFDLVFGNHTAADSIKYSKVKNGYYPQNSTNTNLPDNFIDINNDSLILSALYFNDGNTILRFINYSCNTIKKEKISLNHKFASATVVDFMENELSTLSISNKENNTILKLPDINAWEIVTIMLKEGE